MREILAEAWPSETLGLGGIFRIVSGKVNYLVMLLKTLQITIDICIDRQTSMSCSPKYCISPLTFVLTGKVPRYARLLSLPNQHRCRGQPMAEGNFKLCCLPNFETVICSSTKWTPPSMCFPFLSRGSQINFAERNIIRKFERLLFARQEIIDCSFQLSGQYYLGSCMWGFPGIQDLT